MVVSLREITDDNRDAVVALRVAPEQVRFVGSVRGVLADAAELLTSYVPLEGGPAGFYRRLGFVPTGELDVNGEVIVRLALERLTS